MSILRGPRPEANFYVLDKQIAADTRLSWAARGLLIFLLTKPDSWRVSVEHLRKQTDAARIRTGRNGTYALLQELQAAGYVETQQPRTTNGKLAPVEYVVREKPHPSDRDAVPHPSEPLAAERTQVKTERAARTEEKARAVFANAEAFAPTCPVDVESVVWEEYLQHRQDVGHPLATHDDLEQVRRKLEEIRADGGGASEAIDLAIAAGRVLPLNKANTPDRIIEKRTEQRSRRLHEDLSAELQLRAGFDSRAVGARA